MDVNIKHFALWSLLLGSLATALSAGGGDGGATQECPTNFMKVGDRCLHFATYAAVSHTDAKQLCHSINGVLASVLTPTELKEMVDYINSQGLNEGNYWIDGSDAEQEGTWVASNGEPIPLGTPFWYAYIGHPTPDDDFFGRQDCLVMNQDEGYYFNDVPCDQENRLICEAIESRTGQTNGTAAMAPTVMSDCPELYTPVGGLCLLFNIYGVMTWTEAREWCSGISGDLAAIEEIEDLRALYLHLLNEGLDGYTFWIGATDESNEGTWTWTNGRIASMGTPFWGFLSDNIQEPSGGTSQNCILIYSASQYYFQDYGCSNHYHSICMAN